MDYVANRAMTFIIREISKKNEITSLNKKNIIAHTAR